MHSRKPSKRNAALRAWVKAYGYGAKSELARRSGLSLTSINRHTGFNPPQDTKRATAVALSAATGGVVSVEEIMGLPRKRPSANAIAA